MDWVRDGRKGDLRQHHDVPMLALPKKRPLLVEDDGGGGFWICDAVGAREERMLYVRCMVIVWVWMKRREGSCFWTIWV